MKKTKKILLLSLASISIFFASCVSSKTDIKSVYINSMQRQLMLSEKLKKLYAAGKTVDVQTLFKQLEKEKCDVELDFSETYEINPETIYEEKKNAVVIIGQLYKCGKCTKAHSSAASGFFANNSGIVVTNYHVVNNPKAFAMGVMTYDGEVYPVTKVLAASKKNDVAVIQVDNKKRTPSLQIQPKVDVGSKVWVISHPSKTFYMFTEGIVSGLFERKIRPRQSVKNILITADFGGGSSGAPVLNDKGKVIGIVTSTNSVQAMKCKDGSYAQMVMKNCVPAESILKLFD